MTVLTFSPETPLIGTPHPRVEGPLKVSGQARFAADLPLPGAAHAVLLRSPQGPCRIASIDDSAARLTPGFVAVYTYRDFAGAIRPVKHALAGGQANSTHLPLGSDAVRYPGQMVAMLLADSLEAAQSAAARLSVQYEAAVAPVAGLDAARAEQLSRRQPSHRDAQLGQAEKAFAEAAVQLDARYTTPIQHHNPIELLSTACVWDGDRLTVHEPTRFIGAVRHGLAAQLGISPDKIRVIAPFIGGHFGSKLALSQYTAITALAAQRLGRAVRLYISRAEGFTVANHRPETRHRIRLGADTRGGLQAVLHEASVATSRFDLFAMPGIDVSLALYGCANLSGVERIAEVDRNTPGPMRAPPEVPYLFALESAVDELACRIGMDPIALRRRNDTAVDALSGKRFTSRPLMRCFDAGARAFGWPSPLPPPGTLRQGDWLVGLGCASAARPVKAAPARLRLSLYGEGRALIETAHHEIGNGLYTWLAMDAADRLGLPIDAIDVRLGDTDLPAASLSGGSSTTTSLSRALALACRQLQTRLVRAALELRPDLAADAHAVQWHAGRLVGNGGRTLSLHTVLQERFDGRLQVEAASLPEGMPPEALAALDAGRAQLGPQPGGDRVAWSFGAQFAEVHVHALTRQVRVQRLLGALAAGRVLNPLTARSQLEGGMVWGIGAALFEATDVDARTGRYANENLADYLIACAADVGRIDALIVEDDDREVNQQGVKGLGELGLIGVNAAIVNAIHHATGMRVRTLPVRCEDLLGPAL